MSVLDLKEVMRRRDRGIAIASSGNPQHLREASYLLLSTFNVTMMQPLLVEELDRIGFHASVTLGPHGQLEQEILSPDAALHRNQYDGVVLVLSLEDLLAPLYARPASFSQDEVRALVDHQSGGLQDWRNESSNHAPTRSYI